ncbi:MAG: SUMF1/EgtB/PvdO family nonheme iron enzyme [Chloroflexota bacterium]
MSDSQQTWVGQKIGGRYPIESLLGRGGMSSVYKGVDPHLKRPVAIKLIHKHLSEREEWVKRFEQEAASVAKLRHPNIVQVYDFDQQHNTYYMVMEYVAGETLDKRLRSLNEANLRMPLGDAIRIMILLCEAVAYAHDQQIIHRDLKPANVMINLLGQPVLMDFGIAKLRGNSNVQTATGTTMGTAAYMSPEQITGQEIDHRSDLYALGVIFYEMLNGVPPYEGESALTVMMKHVNEALPDIRLRNSNLPETIVAVLEKALNKAPNNRFQSGFEMANALRLLLGATDVHTAASYSTGGFTPTTSPVPPVQSHPQPTVQPTTVHSPSQPIVPNTPTRGQTQPEQPSESAAPLEPVGKRPFPLVPVAIGAVVLLGLILGAVFLLPSFLSSPPASVGMNQIPAGTYIVGQGGGGGQFVASQQVTLETYWLDRFEVTNAEFAAYAADAGANPPARWANGAFASGEAEHPVQGVTWDMAQAYCEWAGKRLPTEAEWEVAARGANGFLYPWGNETAVVQLASNGTYAKGGIPANRSPFGIYDMAGNVWEWVDEPYASIPADDRLLRGGAYDFQKDMTYRLQGKPDVATMVATAGFRCAASEVEVVAEDSLVLVSDDFTAPDSGWPTAEEGSALRGYHPPDFYHVQSGEQNHIATAYFGGNYQNISLTTDVFVDSTDSDSGDFRYGVIARRNGNQLYAFTVSPRAGMWQVLKGSEAGIQMLQEGAVAGLKGLSENDRLRVDVAGNTLVFAINGEVVTQLADNSYTSGDIGFWVETFDESRAHIHYDLLEVSQIEALPVAADVVLQDEFTDPASGWPETNEADSLSGYHPPDYYHVQSSRPNHTAVAFLERPFSDFTLETNVFVDSTDSENGDFYYGLGVHQNGANYYALLISPRAGQWQVVEQGDAGKVVLTSGADSSLQGLTASDRLRVDAAGGNLVFSLNGRSVAQLDAVATAQGNVGFVVETLDESRAHIHYDSLTIRNVEQVAGPLPTAVAIAAVDEVAATPVPVVEEAVATPVPVPTVVAPTPEGPLPSSIGMTQVAGGSYLVGNGVNVTLADYWIDSYEVTNAQFAAFMEATGQEAPAYWADENIPAVKADHPVRDVTWDVAEIYCGWATKRLPTEAEWEVAARGPHGWFYPWGNNRGAVTLPTQDTYPVGSLVANRSYFGAFDMAGNVWEWVDEPYSEVAEGNRVIRGGANSFQNDMLARPDGDPANGIMRTNTGIRCASDAVIAAEDSTLLLQDEFADINSGWFQAAQPVDAYFYGYHPTDFYHVQVAAPNDCLTVRHQQSFSNFMAEVRVFIASTDTPDSNFRHGLILRESGNAFYAFTISPRTQVWQVVKGGLDGMTVLAQGTAVTIRGLDVDTEDRLFVTANGPEMHFFVNGELVARVVDNDYSEGNVGFLVETLEETYAHIHFDRISVWALPGSVATPPEQNETQPTDIVNPLCRGTISSDDLLFNFTTYTVVQGDTLSSIAGRHGVPLEAILGANGKTIENPRFISVGQTIIIPQT